MSGYLKNILAKSVDQPADIRPRLGSRFEDTSPAAFSNGKTTGTSLLQEQATGTQLHGDGEQEEGERRPEKLPLEAGAPAPARHEQKDIAEAGVSEGGSAAPIPGEKRSAVHDLQVEHDNHGLAPRIREGGTERQELEESSGNIRPLPHGKRTATAAATVQVVTKTSVLQQGAEPAASLSSSPGRERAGRNNRSEHLNVIQDMVGGADRDPRDPDRGSLLIRSQSLEKSGSLNRGVERTTRLLRPDIPEEYGNKKIAPSVQVTIGRIEIRAVREKKQQPREISKPAASQRPALSLDEYLSQRSKRGR